jgi:SAM-dependent methyltransferase
VRLFPEIGRFRPVASDNRIVEGPLALLECADCGVLQKNTGSAWRELAGRIYASYAVNQSDGEEPFLFSSIYGPGPRAGILATHLAHAMPLARRGRLLDIGCANGNFLRAFGAQNPGWALSGLENSTLWRETVLGVPGVEGYHCDLGELDGQRFDLIVMSHVLEHIPDPVHYLAGLGALLEEGGRLCLAVPDIRQNPIDLLVLDHCTHFDAASLGRVLNRGGFPAQALQADIIRREIIAISPFDGVCSDPESAALGTVAADSLAYLTALMARARELRAGNARLGIMGTSTAAIWITGELGMAVDFYVDEDMRRIGKTLFGKPILSLQQVPAGTCVFMPMTGVVARSVLERVRRTDFDLTYLAWT